ncbi:hypothetical protein N1851_025827 [Merluccius polli]|uniref:Uncharacterized protein n=1 Tax=Merluccius polli TaxID=89951 RepID=A0AA47MD84_MERPO|nr:hypothetical protein N1851_025827 [Merluccius polli]
MAAPPRLPTPEPERTEGHRDDDVISSNPLSVLNLHANRLHGHLGVTPVHTAHWSSVVLLKRTNVDLKRTILRPPPEELRVRLVYTLSVLTQEMCSPVQRPKAPRPTWSMVWLPLTEHSTFSRLLIRHIRWARVQAPSPCHCSSARLRRVSSDVHGLVLWAEGLWFQETIVTGQAVHWVLLRRTMYPPALSPHFVVALEKDLAGRWLKGEEYKKCPLMENLCMRKRCRSQALLCVLDLLSTSMKEASLRVRSSWGASSSSSSTSTPPLAPPGGGGVEKVYVLDRPLALDITSHPAYRGRGGVTSEKASDMCHSHGCFSMKRRWSLLPTITETLEDPASPLQLPTAQPTPVSPSTDDYMASIQALARPLEAISFGPVRLQRSARPRLFSKAQTKHSGAALLPRGSPRTSRTSGLSLPAPERITLRTMGDRDCKGRDPVDWLYGQAQMRT